MSFKFVDPSKIYPVDKTSVVMAPDSVEWTPDLEEELADVLEGVEGMHWGQRKLALSKIEFLLRYWDPALHPKITVVEVGGAHGTNTLYIAKLFPQLRWELYDPGSFDNRLRHVGTVILHEGEDGFFTDETAEEWAKRRENGESILFLSDIRNYPKDKTDYALRAQFVQTDLHSQERWCRTIRPVAAQLKFPFIRGGREGQRIANRYFPYLGGAVFFQAWNRPNSYETRLAVTDFDSTVYWDLPKASLKISYVNRYLRREVATSATSDGGFTVEEIPETGLDGSWDAAVEVLVWAHYLEKHGEKATSKLVAKLSAGLSRVLGKSSLQDRILVTENKQKDM